MTQHFTDLLRFTSAASPCIYHGTCNVLLFDELYSSSMRTPSKKSRSALSSTHQHTVSDKFSCVSPCLWAQHPAARSAVGWGRGKHDLGLHSMQFDNEVK